MRHSVKILSFLYVCTFCFNNSHVIGQSNSESKVEVVDDIPLFVPTKEWQKVKEGQPIPPGLHVKMDLSKGGKWAKLLEDDKSNALVQVPSKDEENSESNESSKKPEETSYKVEELKEALKKFKDEKVDSANDEEVKSKFRSMDEIREAFDEFDLHEESDAEVMKRMVAVLQNKTASVKEKHLALQDLEYYVHQIDNANDFVTFGGFAVVVKTLNSTNVQLKEEAAHVIGSAMQSNPKVQIEALRSGALRTLLLTLATTDYPIALRKKCMYAISALVRHFPLAQTHLAQYGGFQIMLDLFQQNNVESLQIKAMHLMNDIIDERSTTEKDIDDPKRKEKLDQYSRINLGDIINELGWCQVISSSLQLKQHSRRESVMRAMKAMHTFCQNDFRNSNVIDKIKKLNDEYRKLSDDDVRDGDTDSYFSSLHQLSTELISLTSSRLKDEF